MTMGFYVPTNRDVKFPKACEQCHFYDGLLCCVMDTYIYDPENKHGECPLIEVSPHGDLIDRDAAAEKIWDDMRFPSNLANAQFFVNELREMPTIIPASGEGET